MSRWIAGAFDPRQGIEAAVAVRALSPHAATALDCGVLQLAYSGPRAGSGEILCLLDGHLDNAEQIAAELGDGPLPDEGDEPLLTRAYRRWGPGLPERMRGDFLLFAWDGERQRGLLARDQLGVRPCFLHRSGGRLCFAGEMRNLLALLPRTPAPDPAGVAHWIAASNRPGSETLYAGVSRLRPGTMLVFEGGAVAERRYWQPRFEEPLAATGLPERIRGRLERSVRRRLAGSGPTGVLMSGGLDSSTVAALCAEDEAATAFACTATFPEHPQADESELIATLEKALSLSGLNAEVRPGGLLASVLEHVQSWALPPLGWGDFWALPLLRAARARGIGTVLGGDGGDELFGPRSYLLADRLLAGDPRGTLALAGRLPGAGPRVRRRRVARVAASLALGGAASPWLDSLLRGPRLRREAPGWMRRGTVDQLVQSDDSAAWKRLDGPRWWAHIAHGIGTGIEQAGVFEHHRRRAVSAGVEARHPLLDLDLVELGLRQPPEATLDPRFNRPLLRAAMEGSLPDAVRLRPQKAWFESLIVDCMRGRDAVLVRRLLTETGAELGAYLDLEAMGRALFDSPLPQQPFRWMLQVWRLLGLECWLRSQSLPAERILPPGSPVSLARVKLATAPRVLPFSSLTATGPHIHSSQV